MDKYEATNLASTRNNSLGARTLNTTYLATGIARKNKLKVNLSTTCQAFLQVNLAIVIPI